MQSRECPSPTSNWDHPFLLAKSFGTPNLVVQARLQDAAENAVERPSLTFPTYITRIDPKQQKGRNKKPLKPFSGLKMEFGADSSLFFRDFFLLTNSK